MPVPLHFVRDIRAMESEMFRRVPSREVMARAGDAAAKRAMMMIGENDSRPALALAGPGNNGGDAMVAAARLRENGRAVKVVFGGDAKKLSADARWALAEWEKSGDGAGWELSDIPSELGDFCLALDGMFGIGLARPVGGKFAEWIAALNDSGVPVLALDIPSGLNADTGVANGPTVRASATITFLGAKPGLFTGDGPDFSGEVFVETLLTTRPAAPAAGRGIPPLQRRAQLRRSGVEPPTGTIHPRNKHRAQAREFNQADAGASESCVPTLERRDEYLKGKRRDEYLTTGFLIDSPRSLSRFFPSPTAHKGTRGTLVLVGGARGMEGALVLAARAAATMGTGKVFAVSSSPARSPFDPLSPEVMWPDSPPDFRTATAVGVGLGTDDAARAMLRAALAHPAPVAADADGLNLIAADEELRAMLSARQSASVLTPHPAEAARLLGCETAEVQADRIAAARELAKMFGAHVALKGAGTVLAFAPDGTGGSSSDSETGGGGRGGWEWAINGTGNPGLARAGSGDVLTGMVGALLAQVGTDVGTDGTGRTGGVGAALECGAWLHGAAADILAAEAGGVFGWSVGELAGKAGRILNSFAPVGG